MFDRRRNSGNQGTCQWRRLIHMHRCEGDLVFSCEGSSTCNHLEEENSQRIDIAKSIGLIIAYKQLGRNVINGAQYIPGTGKCICVIYQACNTKIGEITEVVGTQQNVRRFNIAVNNTMLMYIVEGKGNIEQIFTDIF